MELDSSAARMVGGVYLSGTGGGYGPFLAKDNSGNAVAMGSVYVYPPTAVVTPGAYTPPDFASGCTGIKTNYYGGTGLYVTKLRISDLKTVYGALLTEHGKGKAETFFQKSAKSGKSKDDAEPMPAPEE